MQPSVPQYKSESEGCCSGVLCSDAKLRRYWELMDSSQMISRENVVFDSIYSDLLCYYITYFQRR